MYSCGFVVTSTIVLSEFENCCNSIKLWAISFLISREALGFVSEGAWKH